MGQVPANLGQRHDCPCRCTHSKVWAASSNIPCTGHVAISRRCTGDNRRKKRTMETSATQVGKHHIMGRNGDSTLGSGEPTQIKGVFPPPTGVLVTRSRGDGRAAGQEHLWLAVAVARVRARFKTGDTIEDQVFSTQKLVPSIEICTRKEVLFRGHLPYIVVEKRKGKAQNLPCHRA
eukprot:3135946-Ditylum_brightwellii.AAC.1